MEDEFMLPVMHNGKEMEFPAKLLNYGYTVKMEVEIEGTPVFFERDEDRNWRAILSFEDAQANKKMDSQLLNTVAEAIDGLLK